MGSLFWTPEPRRAAERTPGVIAVAAAYGLGLLGAVVLEPLRDDGVGAWLVALFAVVATLAAWRAHPLAAALAGLVVASFWNFFYLRPYGVLHASRAAAAGTAALVAVPCAVSLVRELVAYLEDRDG